MLYGISNRIIDSVSPDISGIAGENIFYIADKGMVFGLFAVLVFPLLFLLIFSFFPQNDFITSSFLLSGICVMAMPSGLTAVFAPAPYGVDTAPAAECALLSHVLSIITIPLIMLLFTMVFPGLIVF